VSQPRPARPGRGRVHCARLCGPAGHRAVSIFPLGASPPFSPSLPSPARPFSSLPSDLTASSGCWVPQLGRRRSRSVWWAGYDPRAAPACPKKNSRGSSAHGACPPPRTARPIGASCSAMGGAVALVHHRCNGPCRRHVISIRGVGNGAHTPHPRVHTWECQVASSPLRDGLRVFPTTR
jgi:hypothetical protein